MKRELIGKVAILVSIIAIAFALFQLYTSFFGIFESTRQRSIHLTFAIGLSFLVYARSKGSSKEKIPIYDWILFGLAVISYGFVAIDAPRLSARYEYVTLLSTFEIIMGLIGIVILLESARRIVGPTLAILTGGFLLYAFFGHLIPEPIGHRGIRYTWVIDHLFYTTKGIFGIPTGISATYAAIFILLGAFLDKTGAGKFFTDFAFAAMGRYKGGPAKTAVLASGALGMITGSPTGNTATTGAFTIPMMKKLGYSKEFAGAVEAAASTGGQLMPPIMGAAAFILAEFAGVPYLEVIKAALIPSLLFYIGLGFAVHFEADKKKLRSLSAEETGTALPILIKGFYYLIPIAVIILTLVMGYTPLRAGILGIACSILIGLVKAITVDLKKYMKLLVQALDEGARSLLVVAIACGAAGIIIGVTSQTGLGIKLGRAIIALSGESMLLALFFTMLTAIILGMGLPTSAAYIIQAALVIPVLVQMGVPLLSAHLFALYFACLSFITPPIALAAYVGAGIAGGNLMRTGFIAWRLGLVAFIVPYMFVYEPALLMQGTIIEIVLAFITSVVGVIALSAALSSWMYVRLRFYEQITLFIAALLLIYPENITDIIGTLVFVLIGMSNYSCGKKEQIGTENKQEHNH